MLLKQHREVLSCLRLPVTAGGSALAVSQTQWLCTSAQYQNENYSVVSLLMSRGRG